MDRLAQRSGPRAALFAAMTAGGCTTLLGIDEDYVPLGADAGAGVPTGSSTGSPSGSSAGSPAAAGGAAGGTTTSGGAGGIGGTSGDCGPLCECLGGQSCEFTCATPPCDANCSDGSHCTAECAAATCNCNGGSTCDFLCVAANCIVGCNNGSVCTMDCGAFQAETPECRGNYCDAGDWSLCPDGRTLTCNAPCP